VQRKLAVSQPGDQYEQEADRMANAVMRQEQQRNTELSQTISIHRQVPEEELMQAKFATIRLRARWRRGRKTGIEQTDIVRFGRSRHGRKNCAAGFVKSAQEKSGLSLRTIHGLVRRSDQAIPIRPVLNSSGS
jgi:hypothetical protein